MPPEEPTRCARCQQLRQPEDLELAPDPVWVTVGRAGSSWTQYHAWVCRPGVECTARFEHVWVALVLVAVVLVVFFGTILVASLL